MNFLFFIWGWCTWHLRAGIWYAGLGFRLYFAVGLDRDFDARTTDVARQFRCPIKRDYRRFRRSRG